MAGARTQSAAGGNRASLADRLRQARQAKGVSPDEASEQSAVPVRYVRMFEDGNYPVVADPAYLTHFLRRYASYLGLDAERASRDLIDETEPEAVRRRAGKIEKKRSPSAVGEAGDDTVLLDQPAEPAPPSEESEATVRMEKPPARPEKPPALPPVTVSSPERKALFGAGPISVGGGIATLILFLLYMSSGKKAQTPLTTLAEAPPQPAPTVPAAAPTTMPTTAVEGSAAQAPLPEPTMAPTAALPTPAPTAASAASLTVKPAEPKPPVSSTAGAGAAPTHPKRTHPTKPSHKAPSIKSDREATDRASDALRAEQLERLKAKTQGGVAPPAAPTAPAPEAK